MGVSQASSEQRLEQLLDGALVCRVEVAAPREAILAAAADIHPSLTVIGAGRGHDSLRALRGVSRRVAHEASCSAPLAPKGH